MARRVAQVQENTEVIDLSHIRCFLYDASKPPKERSEEITPYAIAHDNRIPEEVRMNAIVKAIVSADYITLPLQRVVDNVLVQEGYTEDQAYQVLEDLEDYGYDQTQTLYETFSGKSWRIWKVSSASGLTFGLPKKNPLSAPMGDGHHLLPELS